jgi:predicted aspartyl protease
MMRISNLLLSLVAVSGMSIAAANAADSSCSLARITSVDTTVGPGGYMLVPVKIGDAQRLMLFDTGGSLSSISAEAAGELHIPTYHSNVRMVNVAGKVSDLMAIIPSITVGTAESKRAEYMVLPGGQMRGLIAGGVIGLLAPAPGVDLDLDFAAHKLAFFSPDHCEGKVVYWPAAAVAVVPMRNAGSRPPSALASQRFTLQTERIMIPVTLDGKQMDALIDTGSTTNVLKLSVAEGRFDVDLKAPDVQPLGQLGGNASAKTYRKRFATLSFEGVTVTNPVLDLIPDKQTGAFGEDTPTGSLIHPQDRGLPDLIIGMSVLSKLHMYVAYKERKVYITAGAAPAGVQQASVSLPADPVLQIAGSWNVTSQPVRPACEIAQNGGELTGTCTGPQARGELTGTVAGQAIRWQWKRIANANGQVSLWNFSGTLSADNTITGFVELNGRTSPFTATK